MKCECDPLEEMKFDEENITKDDKFHNSFKEVDLKVIAMDNYELHII